MAGIFYRQHIATGRHAHQRQGTARIGSDLDGIRRRSDIVINSTKFFFYAGRGFQALESYQLKTRQPIRLGLSSYYFTHKRGFGKAQIIAIVDCIFNGVSAAKNAVRVDEGLGAGSTSLVYNRKIATAYIQHDLD